MRLVCTGYSGGMTIQVLDLKVLHGVYLQTSKNYFYIKCYFPKHPCVCAQDKQIRKLLYITASGPEIHREPLSESTNTTT